MFLVGGGILVHGVAPLHHAIEAFSAGRGGVLTSTLLNAGVGIVAGAAVLAVVALIGKLWRAVRS
ncbi:Inner membrane protein YedI [compost metagenome]